MAANKRRKLNPLPEPENISAFAARKQLQVAHDALEGGSGTTINTYESPLNPEERQLFNSSSLLSSGISTQRFERGIGQELDQPNEYEASEAGNLSDSGEDDEDFRDIASNRKPGETASLRPSDQPWNHFTTMSLSKSNIERLNNSTLRIMIGPGERLVVLGEYGLSVTRGQITILGAILSTSRTIHDICASSSHSLPAIRFFSSDKEKAEILLHQSNSKLRSLRRLSPLFAGLWSTRSGELGASNEIERQSWRSNGDSFQILLSQDGDPHMGYNPTVSPPEWNELLSMSVSDRPKDGTASTTMVCGPKSSGKSTFAKLLVNRLLTFSQAQWTESCVAFIDLDPGQPEFSPPGQLSLFSLSKPNFGPPFSHPDASKMGFKLIRAHSISAVSPSSDPDFYMACAIDLLSCYRKLEFPTLVINTPGWILGTGLELLTLLIKRAQPTQVIYMSQDGPLEVIESLQAAAKPISISTLPSQPTENLPRTSAHLRTMQYMSYFHLDSTSSVNYVWNSNSITSMAPLEVKYAGKAAGILGILCLGEQPPTKMLRDTIDGSLVAVVVIEDVAAILSSEDKENIDEDAFVIQTPEGIPYFNPANGLSLDPACSHTIGLAIVRGIDVRQQRLQLLTPMPARSIKDIRASGKAIILVSGKLDIPGWAYLETFYEKDANIKGDSNLRESEEVTPHGGDERENKVADGYRNHTESFEKTPWVELLQGDKGRDVGSRVWRVRRDLGKTSGGD